MLEHVKKKTQPKNRITSYSTKKRDITSFVCLFYWGKSKNHDKNIMVIILTYYIKEEMNNTNINIINIIFHEGGGYY